MNLGQNAGHAQDRQIALACLMPGLLEEGGFSDPGLAADHERRPALVDPRDHPVDQGYVAIPALQEFGAGDACRPGGRALALSAPRRRDLFRLLGHQSNAACSDPRAGMQANRIPDHGSATAEASPCHGACHSRACP